jgi:phosphohistidine phosphatase
MMLYLVQHGEAKRKEEDPKRPLTARGEEDVRRVAEFARRAGVQVDQIRHSGKRRAEQTADILARALRPPHGVMAVSGLNPEDPVEPVARALAAESASLMLVGHLPFLAALAAELITGNHELPVVRFQMGGIVGLERNGSGDWSLAWMVTPDLLPKE